MNRRKLLLTILSLFFFISACSLSHQKIQSSHLPLSSEETITNEVIEEELLSPTLQQGLASWYGPGFYGKKTASGQKFLKQSFTAAHRSLPFGTRLKVINQLNGKEVEVVVNDRGPFIKGRILDLSYVAAKELGITKKGCAPVEIKKLLATNENKTKFE